MTSVGQPRPSPGIVGGVFYAARPQLGALACGGWIAFHEVLSYFHSWPELVVHTLLFVGFAYFLFRPQRRNIFVLPEQWCRNR